MSYIRIHRVSAVLLSFALFLSAFACERSKEKTFKVDMSKKVQEAEVVVSNAPEPIRIAIAAVISPKETAVYYEKMVEYIAVKYGSPAEMVQRKTYQEINDLMEDRKIDLAFVCSGPYVSGKEKFGMELLVAPMLYGKPFYQAYIIVNKDSQIREFKDLRGKRFAFTDPESNTGKLVPTYMLSRMNETPESFFSSFIYTYSHDSSIRAVSRKLVDGASVDGLIWEFYGDKKPEAIKSTKVIAKSPLYGIPPVVVHPSTPLAVKKRLKDIFLAMHKDPEGKKILDELRIERFIVPEDSAYDSVRQMESWLSGKR